MTAYKISDCQDKCDVDLEAIVESAEVRPAKNGKFLQFDITDGTGKIRVNWWQVTAEDVAEFSELAAARFKGSVSKFRDSLSVNTNDAPERLDPEPLRRRMGLGCTLAPEQLQARLAAHLASVEDPALNALLRQVFFEDCALAAAFEKSPAAVRRHHAYASGLLEHTLEVTDAAVGLLDAHRDWAGKPPDHDLTVACALLHDIGKVEEIHADNKECGFTLAGEMLGHTTLGILLITKCIAAVRRRVNFPDDLEKLVLHAVASHHGKLDWGAIEEPKLPEAFVVHMADLVSATLFEFRSARRDAPPGKQFTGSKLTRGSAPSGRQVFTGEIRSPQSDAVPAGIVEAADFDPFAESSQEAPGEQKPASGAAADAPLAAAAAPLAAAAAPLAAADASLNAPLEDCIAPASVAVASDRAPWEDDPGPLDDAAPPKDAFGAARNAVQEDTWQEANGNSGRNFEAALAEDPFGDRKSPQDGTAPDPLGAADPVSETPQPLLSPTEPDPFGEHQSPQGGTAPDPFGKVAACDPIGARALTPPTARPPLQPNLFAAADDDPFG